MFDWQKINKNKIRLFIVLGFLVSLFFGIYMIFFISEEAIAPKEENNQISEENENNKNTDNKKEIGISLPLEDALSRITKKPFGIYITPETSPVQPERFSGYHTGTDFEIKEGEENKNVDIYAICTGQIVRKRIVSGYGGTVIQECKINNKSMLVLYGHISLDRVSFNELDKVEAGTKIAILADANSEMSGGERKHLHLGIYKGTIIDYAGYVTDKKDLSEWLNFEDLL